jgi:hypothetical protein
MLGFVISLIVAVPALPVSPAVIDCRAPVDSPALQTLIGECDGRAQTGWYRSSRYPESEKPSGTLGPSRRDRDIETRTVIRAGVPHEGSGVMTPSPNQPLALFAVPELPDLHAALMGTPSDRLPASRQLRPVERPPRV